MNDYAFPRARKDVISTVVINRSVRLNFRLIRMGVMLAVIASGAPPHGRVLYRDDFHGPLRQWIAELEKPGRLQSGSGTLDIDVPAGCTLWFARELSGSVEIEYDALMVKAGGPNDRVSDLNAFWMASDARSPEDFFAAKRSGAFADYNQLRTYYVGQGGNSNTTTRFRRYIGSVSDRPLLPEHDLRTPEMLLTPNVWQHVQLIADNGHIQYRRNETLIFDFTDPVPYVRGYFGFRTTFSHVKLRRFRVYRRS